LSESQAAQSRDHRDRTQRVADNATDDVAFGVIDTLGAGNGPRACLPRPSRENEANTDDQKRSNNVRCELGDPSDDRSKDVFGISLKRSDNIHEVGSYCAGKNSIWCAANEPNRQQQGTRRRRQGVASDIDIRSRDRSMRETGANTVTRPRDNAQSTQEFRAL
jgi:hypothetical protein